MLLTFFSMWMYSTWWVSTYPENPSANSSPIHSAVTRQPVIARPMHSSDTPPKYESPPRSRKRPSKGLRPVGDDICTIFLDDVHSLWSRIFPTKKHTHTHTRLDGIVDSWPFLFFFFRVITNQIIKFFFYDH